jgi:hypothetical protein
MMDDKEYDKKLQEIKSKFGDEKSALKREYAFSNNTVKIGDKITDHCGSIEVESINITLGFMKKYPECVYYGIGLKKDMTPRKDGSKRHVYQSDIEGDKT